MKILYYSLLACSFLIILLLLNSLFYGENSFSKKASLLEENKIHKNKINELNRENEILEFEIINAQNSNDHVENFAREELNLTYPNEEFISFKKDKKNNENEE
ncbi:MAG: hypothetical protein CMD58_04735 [Gammaproteobacteria bacterium]|nr:hypothetical protein [Gammaproteobacteria bacterium]|tara:strand:- start:486 stop:794 length:309 start_codon:yes stop_codon:yes gene_type:complete